MVSSQKFEVAVELAYLFETKFVSPLLTLPEIMRRYKNVSLRLILALFNHNDTIVIFLERKLLHLVLQQRIVDTGRLCLQFLLLVKLDELVCPLQLIGHNYI